MSQIQLSSPDDYAAIRWMQSHVSGNPVVLEATGGEYDFSYARVSTFTGLPTVMGWAGHEEQWRPNDSEIAQRVNAVNEIYRTPSVTTAKRLLHAYNVRYVFAGSTERNSPGFNLAKFKTFMRVADKEGTTTVYTW